jgi:hypothetical protein
VIAITCKRFSELFEGMSYNGESIRVVWENSEEYVTLREDLRATYLVCGLPTLTPDRSRQARGQNEFLEKHIDTDRKKVLSIRYPEPVILTLQVSCVTPYMTVCQDLTRQIQLRVGTRKSVSVPYDVFRDGKSQEIWIHYSQTSTNLSPRQIPGKRGWQSSSRYSCTSWIFHESSQVVDTFWNLQVSTIQFNLVSMMKSLKDPVQVLSTETVSP